MKVKLFHNYEATERGLNTYIINIDLGEASVISKIITKDQYDTALQLAFTDSAVAIDKSDDGKMITHTITPKNEISTNLSPSL